MANSKSNAKPLVLITLLVVVILITLFLINNSRETATDTFDRVDELPSLAGQPLMGNEDAPVTVIEFGDYKCPACKAWDVMVFPRLKSDYIDTGKVKFSYVNTLFHGEESEVAALAAESVLAQDPDAFWTYSKSIFEAQPHEDHDALWITEDKLMELARSHIPEIDLVKLEGDIQNETALPQVRVDDDLVRKYAIRMTPTIMINGIIVEDPFDYDMIQAIIDSETGAAN